MNEKVILVKPQEDLIAKVADLLLSFGSDKSDSYKSGSVSNNIVVFPGKRPSHFLRQEILKKSGKSFEPPAIFSMDSFVEHIFEKLRIPGRDINEMDAMSVLLDELSEGGESIIGNRKLSLDEFLSWGFKLLSDI
ncbi:MAG: hypothetical protein AB1633_12020, partial [Elusimicrobiota bacterium]